MRSNPFVAPPTRSRHASHRAGFSLVEVLIALTIMVTMAAVVTPVLVGSLDRARYDRAEKSLTDIADALDRFSDDLKETPASISQTVHPVSTSDDNACGESYHDSNGKGGTRAWDGPYFGREIPASGLPIGIGKVQDTLQPVIERSWGWSRLVGVQLVVPSVSVEDAVALNDRIDGDGSPTSGAIRWSAGSDPSLVTVYYVLPARGC